MDRTMLQDEQWARIEQLLPGKKRDPSCTAKDNRRFVQAVLWIMCTGSPWRDLPGELAHWHRTYRRIEKQILGFIRNALVTQKACDQFVLDVKRGLKKRASNVEEDMKHRQRSPELIQKEIDHLPYAIKAGIITPRTKKVLENAEHRRAEAQIKLNTAQSLSATALARMTDMIPKALDQYRDALDNIETTLGSQCERARILLQNLLGEIRLKPQKQGLEAYMKFDWRQTLSLSENDEVEKLQVLLVAGAGFEPTTFGL